MEDYVLAKLERDPSVWDSPTDLLNSVKDRMVWDRAAGGLLILDHEVSSEERRRYSAQNSVENVSSSNLEGVEETEVHSYLASGGSWPSLHPFLPGHYDVTKEVLSEPNLPWSFSSVATEILAAASRDPDLFEWSVPAAHAQTPNEGLRPEPVNMNGAMHRFNHWMGIQLTRVRASCEKEPRQALYFLGRSLHGVQDLASHRGMTNAEHSWLSSYVMDPDARKENLDLAKVMTRDYLERVAKPFLGSCYERLQSFHDPVGPWLYGEITGKLGFIRDLSMDELLKYRAAGDAFQKRLRESPAEKRQDLLKMLHVEWFRRDEWRPVMDQLRDALLSRASAGNASNTP